METLSPQATTLSPTHVEGARRGIQLSFILLEPVVYLRRSGTPSSSSQNNPAVLRGSLHLKITEPTKIRSIRVYFHGLAQLRLWGEAPHKEDLITSGISYFDHGRNAVSDSLFRQDHYHLSEKCMVTTETCHHANRSVQALRDDQILPPEYDTGSLDQSGLLDGGSESLSQGNNSKRKGCYRLFPAGDYTYPFEFLVHDFLPESINTGLLSTGYYLEATIESPRLFRSKMRSQLDVPLVRLPSENSLELIEPILYTKDWHEQLHYDACILGRSFCLGSRIPIRLKLTPLANVDCPWITVHVIQLVQYSRMHREPRRLPAKRVLLFQKQAGIASYSTYPGSRVRITSGKGTGRHTDMQKPKLLGRILETSEVELEVQLPRCPEIEVKQQWQRLQPSAKGGRLEVSHWIQITLCLSNEDENETATSNPKVLRFPIIESPITILSCKATPANIYAPPYTVEPDITATPLQNRQCDCVDSASPKTLASVEQAQVPGTEESSVKPVLLSDLLSDITRPLSFDSCSTDIKSPAQVHLPDSDLSYGPH